MKFRDPLLTGVWHRCSASLAVAGGLSLLTAVFPARADLAAQGGARSLGTLINGERGGRCSAGLCVVGGGTAAGNNLFHRLSAFDTRGAIRGVRFQNRDAQTVVVGVTSPWGSWIDKTIAFAKPGNLLLLSPGGIQLGSGAGFVGINQLGLSTATRLALQGGGVFDVFTTIAYDAAALAGAPLLKANGLLVDAEARQAAGITSVPGIVAEGVEVSVDRDLLLDAVDGSVQVRDSQLVVQPDRGEGGSITLSGQSVEVLGASQLKAQGAAAGGLIQIGGSWQNSDPGVRQALTTSIDPTVVLDASATESGNGGTIVAWSDVRNPASRTSALGTFLANAGPQGGDGGRIETSGYDLKVDGIRIFTAAEKGQAGLWLLDPADITIHASPGTVQGVTSGSGILFGTTASQGTVDAGVLQAALAGSNVLVTTAGGNGGNGDITYDSSASISVNSPYTLTLSADRNIIFNGSYTQTGAGGLALHASSGGVTGTGSIALGGGTVEVRTGLLNPSQQNPVFTPFTGIISGANTSLVKLGAGVFELGSEQTYTGSTNIREGTLRLTGVSIGGGLSDSSSVDVAAGATFSQAKSFPEVIGSLAGDGNVEIATSFGGLTIGANNESTTFSGVISGPGPLQKVGTGTLTLSGVNTYGTAQYSRATTISGGVLAIASDASLGFVPGQVSPEWISLSGNGKLEAAGTFSLNPNRGIYIDGDGVVSIGAQSGQTLTYNGSISGVATASPPSLRLDGPGTILLGGLSSYPGGTILTTTVEINHANALSAGLLSFGSFAGSTGRLRYGTGVTTDFSSRFASAQFAPVAIDTNGQDIAYASPIAPGAYADLTKAGSGQLALAGASELGDVFVAEGKLKLLNSSALGSSALVSVAGGAELNIGYSGAFLNPVTSIAAAQETGQHAVLSCSLNCSIGGLINLFSEDLRLQAQSESQLPSSISIDLEHSPAAVASSVGAYELQFAQLPSLLNALTSGLFNVKGPIATSQGGIRVSGGASVVLAAENTFSGPVNIDQGILALIPSSSPSIGPNGVLGNAVSVSLGANGILDLSASEAIGSLAGLAGSVVTLGPAVELSVGVNHSSTIFAGGIGQVSGSSPGQLVKLGAGTLTLTGPNTYTGPTIVSAGTLTVTGSGPTSATCSGGASNLCSSSQSGSSGGAESQSQVPPQLPASTNGGTVAAGGQSGATTAQGGGSTGGGAVDPKPSTSLPGSSDVESKQEDAIARAIEDAVQDDPVNTTQPQVIIGMVGDSEIGNPFVESLSLRRTSPMAVQPVSLEDVEGLRRTLGESSFERQGLSIEISLGSSFTTEASELGISVQGDSPMGVPDPVASVSNQASSAGSINRVVSAVPAQEAVQQATDADLSQGRDALESLIPEAVSTGVQPMSSQAIQQSLQNAADLIRRGSSVDETLPAPRNGRPLETSLWGKPSIADDPSLVLLASAASLGIQADVTSGESLPPSFKRARYNPAVLHIRFTEDQAGSTQAAALDRPNAFLDLTLMPSQGEAVGRRVEVSRADFTNDLKQLYRQLSRQESLDVQNPAAPSRRLYAAMFAAIEPILRQKEVTTLLISADRGLQAVPFAALHNGRSFFGDAYAFSLTPSLALTSLAPPIPAEGRLLAAGSAVFDGLAPLPLVPTELDQVGQIARKDKALNRDFTPQTLLEQAADHQYSRVHVATHAEFLPGGPASSRLYSGTLPIPLSDFVKLRRERQDAPLDLISFSACRTALGDAESELGFAGLALQSGARSAVGTLWYVDDVATSAYFVQMYRYLDAGIPKAEALQLTRQAFSRGLVYIQGDRVMGPDGRPLISGLTSTQQRRFESGFRNPYFWAGIELLGSAW